MWNRTEPVRKILKRGMGTLRLRTIDFHRSRQVHTAMQAYKKTVAKLYVHSSRYGLFYTP